MFERFTDRARRVLVLAQEEARDLNHAFIGTEHILLGLIRDGEGVAAQALDALGVTLAAVREKVEEAIGPSSNPSPGSPPFTPRAKIVLEMSLREALQLGHSYIGSEHMLLGLVREGDGVAAQVLNELGADMARVRTQVIQMMSGRVEKPSGRGDVPSGHVQEQDLLSPSTRQVLHLAHEAAHELCHTYVGSEHLLLGLLREGDSVAATALNDFGITFDAVREKTEKVRGVPSEPSDTHLALSSRAGRVLDLARSETRQFDQFVVGPEHLLLAILRVGDSLAFQLLADLGAEEALLRAKVVQYIQERSLRDEQRLAQVSEAAPVDQARLENAIFRGVVRAVGEQLRPELDAATLDHRADVISRLLFLELCRAWR